LIEGKNQRSTALKVQYGWPGKLSPAYQLVVAGWTSTLRPYGVEIELEGISEICATGGINEGKQVVWQEEYPHKIIEKIAQKHGYTAEVVPTKSLKTVGMGLTETADEPIKLDQGSMSDLNFAVDVVTKYAVSEKGEGDYVCQIDDVNKKIIFKPRREVGDQPICDFVYFATKDTEVIEWSVVIPSDIMKGITGSGGNIVAVNTNSVTGGKKKTKLSNVENTSFKVIDSNMTPVSSLTQDKVTSEIKTVLPSAPSFKIPNNYVMNTYLKLFNLGGYNGTLRILGDPSIVPGVFVNIMVYDGLGNLHYTSGRYLVEEVEDVIESGFFTTTLTVRKNAGVEGVEVAKGRK